MTVQQLLDGLGPQFESPEAIQDIGGSPVQGDSMVYELEGASLSLLFSLKVGGRDGMSAKKGRQQQGPPLNEFLGIMQRFNKQVRQEERSAQLAQDTMSGEDMGAGDNKRAAEARKVAEEKNQREAQAKQQAATDKAVKEDQLVEKFARIALEAKGKAARFQGSHDKVLRLVRNRGVVDKETINILAGVMTKAVEAEDTEANRELRVNAGLLGRAENLGTQIILTDEDNAKSLCYLFINIWLCSSPS